MPSTQSKYRCDTDGKSLTIRNINTDLQYLIVSFHRTIRVPDNVEISLLPPDLGCFPLYKIKDYTSRLPCDLASKGGVFLPMYRTFAFAPAPPS